MMSIQQAICKKLEVVRRITKKDFGASWEGLKNDGVVLKNDPMILENDAVILENDTVILENHGVILENHGVIFETEKEHWKSDG